MYGLGRIGSAALAMAIAAMRFDTLTDPIHHLRRSNGVRRKAGKTYPHSSTRQQARYARQIAAGLLEMAGVEGAPARIRRAAAKVAINKAYGS